MLGGKLSYRTDLGWGEGSSRGVSKLERQDTEDWEAAKAIKCQDSGIPLRPERSLRQGLRLVKIGGAKLWRARSMDEQEVKREETPRTREWEEEEVRAAEPVVVGGVESEWAWHKEPEGKAGADGHKVAGDGKESEQVVSEAATAEIQGPGAKGG